jgi:hypothetical protein
MLKWKIYARIIYIFENWLSRAIPVLNVYLMCTACMTSRRDEDLYKSLMNLLNKLNNLFFQYYNTACSRLKSDIILK